MQTQKHSSYVTWHITLAYLHPACPFRMLLPWIWVGSSLFRPKPAWQRSSIQRGVLTFQTRCCSCTGTEWAAALALFSSRMCSRVCLPACFVLKWMSSKSKYCGQNSLKRRHRREMWAHVNNVFSRPTASWHLPQTFPLLLGIWPF